MARKPKLGLPLQTLRNAPDALEGRRLRGGIIELDPGEIETDGRFDDRLRIEVGGLKASIAANGQRVPILVRPLENRRYGLIYGRRRLQACRELGHKVRAIVTESSGGQALRDQLLENQERHDLSFIERALVATALLDGDHLEAADRSNRGVAEVLNLTEAGVSQLLTVVRGVGEDLIAAIGPAPGIGRPRWEELKKALATSDTPRERLLSAAVDTHAAHAAAPEGASDKAFLAVLSAAQNARAPGASRRGAPAPIEIPGVGEAAVAIKQDGRRLRLDLTAEETDFIRWVEGNARELIDEIHARWKRTSD